jgi:subfamily B ATP-binding cassette protein MsbA
MSDTNPEPELSAKIPDTVRTATGLDSSVLGYDDFSYQVARPTFGALIAVIQLVRPYWRGLTWLGPLIIILGIVAAIAEGAGVGLIVVLLSIMLKGQAEISGGGDGELVDGLVQRLFALTGGNIGVVASIALAFILLRIVSVSAHRVIATVVEARVSHTVRMKLFNSFLTMPIDEIAGRSYGDMMTVLDRHSWSIAEAMDGIANMVLTSVVAVLIGGLILVLAPSVVMIAIAGTILLTLLLRFADGPAERAGSEASYAARQVNAQSVRVLQAMRTIRAFGRFNAERTIFEKHSGKLRHAAAASDLTSSLGEPVSQFVYLAMICIIAVAAVNLDMSYDVVLASVALLYRIQPYASAFESSRIHLATLLAPLQAVEELIALAPSSRPGGEPINALTDVITFDAVNFGYAGQPRDVLSDASFTLKRGEWTLIHGDSGSGKSTIINLLLGFYQPISGRISIDGRPLDSLDIDQWRGCISVCGQDVELIDGTIYDNIRLGNSEASDAAVADIVALVGLDRVFAEMDLGGETPIGERGSKLSGGQRQRVGIARALLRNPDILFLDEATSALDSASEACIFAGLVNRMAGRTVVLIGHRLTDDLPIASVVTVSLGAHPNVVQRPVEVSMA